MLVDWDKEWRVVPGPCKIWCFVDLSNADLPTECATIQHGDIDLKKGVSAVVECGECSEEEDDIIASDLFRPLSLEVDGSDHCGRPVALTFVSLVLILL